MDNNKIHEECGVFGVFAKSRETVVSTCYYGLFALQHRGQESCGIAVNDDGVFNIYKDTGMVNDVFTVSAIKNLGLGNMAIGHVRYGTTGSSGRNNAQPMLVNHVKGSMALCHNGNLVNSYELRSELEMNGSIFHTTSDTEVISYIITKERLTSPSIEEAINRAMTRLKGAYSLVVMSPTKMIAVRDEYGFRPLCYGEREDGSYVVASETCALDAVGAKFVRDIRPGEIVVFDKNGIRTITEHCEKVMPRMCIFEYIYFARPDSIVDGVCVHEARVRAGRQLAIDNPIEADVVVGVPDSGIDAAIGYARESNIPYGIGFIKNRYIGRTFIAPGQKVREDRVRIKLNVVKNTVCGKRVVLIDDSIVRGTTSARIVKLLRDAGASEVHMRVTAPAFLNPCYYGTDIDSRDALIACHYSTDEIAGQIGVDSLGYFDKNKLGVLMEGSSLQGYCSACFDGKYPTIVPDKSLKNRFEIKIGDANKSGQ